jgi:hypothetical protein
VAAAAWRDTTEEEEEEEVESSVLAWAASPVACSISLKADSHVHALNKERF